MKTEKKSILKGVVISGMIAGAMPVVANTNSLFNYEAMGTGSELRAELFEQYGSPINVEDASSSDYVVGEAKCGESKCGEGKCGKEEKKDTKKDSKKEAKKSSEKEKTSEATCGEKSKEKKDTKDKTKEAKCGENTCGGVE